MNASTARRAAGTIASTLLVAALATSSAAAATLTVGNTTDDPGDCSAAATCSLRQAVADANATAGADTIDFALPSPSVISLTNGSLLLNDPTADGLTITGPGAASLTVRRDPAAPPFTVIIVRQSSVTMSGFTISGGAGPVFSAGAIDAFGDATLDRMAVVGNAADGGGLGTAGAIMVRNWVMKIRNSLISDNRVTASGGPQGAGAIVSGGRLELVNSTITGNEIAGTLVTDAGAINSSGVMIANNATITGNSATSGTGGVYGQSPLHISNTILAGNTGGASADCGGVVVSQGHNLIGSVVGGCLVLPAASDQVATAPPINPLLLGLASNGGPTQTRALQLTSPARDAGNPATPSDAAYDPPPDLFQAPDLIPCATTDQRGVVRPAGTRCDIGAFELVPPPPAPLPPPPPPAVAVPPAPPPASPFVAPPIDHFKCYDAAGRFRARDVRLRDQFAGSARSVRVRRTLSLCNPVSKNAGRVRSPQAHLTCYATRDRDRFSRRRVVVTNQSACVG